MTRNNFGIRLLCAMAACLAVAAPAAAQRPMGGPFSGLFKGSPREQPQTLDVHASLFGGWDDNLQAQLPTSPFGGGGVTGIDPRQVEQGVANGLQASLAYGFRTSGTRSQVNVGAGASVMAFASSLGAQPVWLQSYTASTGFSTNLTHRTALSLTGAASYAPYYQYAPFLRSTTSEESPVGTDYGYAVESEWVRSTSVAATLSHQLTKTSTIAIGTGRTESVIAGKKSVGDVGAGTFQISYSHSLTRKLAFRVGYGLARTTYGNNIATPTEPETSTGTTASTDTSVSASTSGSTDATPSTETSNSAFTHSLDIGLGYGDGITLKLGRHYVLTLGVGAAIAKNGDARSVALTGKSTALTLTGNATLSRSIGRSWGTSVGYYRGTSYVVGFSQQMVTDSAFAGIGGPITSRIHFSAGAGASQGQLLFAATNGSIISYTGSARLSYALFSHLALYGQASYYRFSLPPGLPNFGFLPALDRRSAMVGLGTWLPLIKHRRARSDSGGQSTAGQL